MLSSDLLGAWCVLLGLYTAQAKNMSKRWPFSNTEMLQFAYKSLLLERLVLGFLQCYTQATALLIPHSSLLSPE